MIKIKDKILTEKYRPTTWENFISDDKEKLMSMIKKPFSMPHLLLVSKCPGTGKTSLAKLIIKQLDAEYLILNSSTDRKIDTIRTKIVQFASTQSINPKVPKIILLDEIDGTPKLTQEALRNVMETYSSNCKFILTANNFNKLHDAIVSRCIRIDFKSPNKENIFDHLVNICQKENITYDGKGINKLIEFNYPSIRDMINVIQSLQMSGKNVSEGNIKKREEEFETLWTQIKNGEFNDVRRYIIENNTNCRELNNYVWMQVLDLKLSQQIASILIQLSENEYRFSVGAEYNITFITSLIKIISLWRQQDGN